MAWTTSVNRVFPLTTNAWHQDAIFVWKTLLKAAGWTVVQSSTGLGGSWSSNNGDVILSAANLNANAWFQIRAPAVSSQQRSMTVKHISTDNEYDVFYSAAAGFSGGSPSSTVPPTATDGQQINPTATAWIPGDGASICDYIIGGSAEKYAFAVIFRARGTNVMNCGLGLDVLSDCSSFDADQAVMWRCLDTTMWSTMSGTDFWKGSAASATGTTVNSAFGWFRKGLSSAAFVNMGGLATLGNSNSGLGYINNSAQGYNLYNGNVEYIPLHYGRTPDLASAKGYKGRSGMFLMIQGGLDEGSIVTVGSQRYLSLGMVATPWDATASLLSG